MKSKLAACIAIAPIIMGKKMEKGKSTLEVEWKNSKGEKKHFTINDIEKEFKPEEIKGQTFIQEGIKTMGKAEAKTETQTETEEKEGKYCDSYRRPRKCIRKYDSSRSASLECREGGRYKYPSSSRSCSHSSRSSRSSSRGSDLGTGGACDYYGKGADRYTVRKYSPYKYGKCEDKYDRHDILDGDEECRGYKGYKKFRPYKRGGKLRRAYRKGRGKARKIIGECGTRRGGRYGGRAAGYSKDKIDFDYGRKRSLSRGDDYIRRMRSRSDARKNVYTMQHRPRYDMRGWDVGCEAPRPEIVPAPIDHYRRRANDQAYINRNRDARRKAVNLDEVNRCLRNERARRNMMEAQAAIARKNQNAKETKRYLNKNAKINKRNFNKEACSADTLASGKNANKFSANLANKRSGLRHHSLDAKNSNSLMNIKDRCKEGLCMNEMDNDNLRSDQKVIEEFDKLEHYKKVNECNRSAEKNNNCNVKKRNDIDKNAKQCSRKAANGRRRKGTHAYANANKRNAFDYNNYMNRQANRKIFTDQAECLKDNKYLKACADNRSNDNLCQDANSANMDRQDYDNLMAKCNDKRMRNRDYGYNDRVCALRDQNLCNDEEGNNDPCYY